MHYYGQLASGQLELLQARQPIDDLLADPTIEPALKARLRIVERARRFASEQLDLPANGSYTLYADLQRDYVLWNVFAAPELSLAPVQWCYPLLGCFAYRGFYAEADAQAAAASLRRKGYDVDVGGVPAYSTLGWFDDPVTNTMMRWDDGELVGTIFHELAHQRVYASSDTAFNESYANFVQAEGLREFRAAGLLPGISVSDAAAAETRQRQFVALVLACRERLDALYRTGLPDEAKRSGKATEFERLRADYHALRDGAWQGYSGYDGWFARPLNNASLLPFGLYEGHGAAFEVLFERCGRNWRRFHAEARRLARLGATQRASELQALQRAAGNKPGATSAERS